MRSFLLISWFLALAHLSTSQTSFELVLPLDPEPRLVNDFNDDVKAHADVDGDNDLDVVTLGRNPAIHLNDGNGNFSVAQENSFEIFPFESMAAFVDINQDGDYDLFVTGKNSLGNFISKFYSNDGNGSYSEMQNVDFEKEKITSFDFGDVDNDNDLDIVISGIALTSGEYYVRLYLNDGSGLYTEDITTPFDQVRVNHLAFSDMDDDGDTDLVIMEYSDEHQIRFFSNNGDGEFEIREEIHTNFLGGTFHLVDIDNDVDRDLLILGDDNRSKLFLNEGDWSMIEVEGPDLSSNGSRPKLNFSDLDGDGDSDFVATGSINKTYSNNGNGVFTSSALGFTSFGFSVLIDVDGDLDNDLIVGDKIYVNDGLAKFKLAKESPLLQVDRGESEFADIDNDGDLDLVVMGQADPVLLYNNDGNGNYTKILGRIESIASNGAVEFADVDNDGDVDLLFTGSSVFSATGLSARSTLYENNGSKRFTTDLDKEFVPITDSDAAFADIDNDGDLDMLLIGECVDFRFCFLYVAKMYLNDGLGMFSEVEDTPFEGVRKGSISFGDVDGDNDQDVLITGLAIDDVSFFEDPVSNLYINDGLGNYIQAEDAPFEEVSNSHSEFCDVDDDGDVDLLITGLQKDNANDSPPRLYVNDGSANFSMIEEIVFDASGEVSFAFADIDNDGDQDVMLGSNTNTSHSFYLNDGNGGFSKEEINMPGLGSVRDISFADIDNDGDQDFVTLGDTKLFRNTLNMLPIFSSTNEPRFDELSTDLVLDINATSGNGLNDAGITYQLAIGDDESLFDLNVNTGQLSFKSPPDFETPLDEDFDNAYSIEVNAFDDTKTATQQIDVYIVNLNEEGPIFTTPAQFDRSENSFWSGVVATDSDGDRLSFSITGGIDSNLFSINGLQQLVWNESPDFENPMDSNQDNVYHVGVEVTDGLFTNSRSFDINVVDANDRPVIETGTFHINENSRNGTVVGVLEVSDQDNDPLSFTITSGNNEGGFAIDQNTAELIVNDHFVLDFERKRFFVMLIEASDGVLAISAPFMVVLNDVENEIILSTQEALNFKVYPNPVKNWIKVDSEIPITKKHLLSLDGKIIKRFGAESRIDMSNIPKGIYVLAMLTDKGTWLKKKIMLE